MLTYGDIQLIMLDQIGRKRAGESEFIKVFLPEGTRPSRLIKTSRWADTGRKGVAKKKQSRSPCHSALEKTLHL